MSASSRRLPGRVPAKGDTAMHRPASHDRFQPNHCTLY
jgi:hypothetical protein